MGKILLVTRLLKKWVGTTPLENIRLLDGAIDQSELIISESLVSNEIVSLKDLAALPIAHLPGYIASSDK